MKAKIRKEKQAIDVRFFFLQTLFLVTMNEKNVKRIYSRKKNNNSSFAYSISCRYMVEFRHVRIIM